MQIYSDKRSLNKRRRIFRIRIYLLFLSVVLLAVAVFYLLIFSSLFKIRSIAVENNNIFSETEILGMLKPIILGGKIGGLAGFDNLLSWPNGKITVPDLAVSDINVTKNWFKRTIDLKVDERQRFAIWCVDAGQNCYWMDKQGIIFGEAPSTEGSLVSVVFDSRTGGLVLGSRVEEERFIGNLISVLENFGQSGFTAGKINFDLEKQELAISTEEGTLITFGLCYNSAKDIYLIKDLNCGKSKYIDLTVGTAEISKAYCK